MDIIEVFALEVAKQTAALASDGDLNTRGFDGLRKDTPVAFLVAAWVMHDGWD